MSKTIKEYMHSLNIRKITISTKEIHTKDVSISVKTDDEHVVFSVGDIHNNDDKKKIANRICHSLTSLRDSEKALLYNIIMDKWVMPIGDSRICIYGNRAIPSHKICFYNTSTNPEYILKGLLYVYNNGVYSIYGKSLSLKKIRKRACKEVLIIPDDIKLHIILNNVCLKDIIVDQTLYRK